MDHISVLLYTCMYYVSRKIIRSERRVVAQNNNETEAMVGDMLAIRGGGETPGDVVTACAYTCSRTSTRLRASYLCTPVSYHGSNVHALTLYIRYTCDMKYLQPRRGEGLQVMVGISMV